MTKPSAPPNLTFLKAVEADILWFCLCCRGSQAQLEPYFSYPDHFLFPHKVLSKFDLLRSKCLWQRAKMVRVSRSRITWIRNHMFMELYSDLKFHTNRFSRRNDYKKECEVITWEINNKQFFANVLWK